MISHGHRLKVKIVAKIVRFFYNIINSCGFALILIPAFYYVQKRKLVTLLLFTNFNNCFSVDKLMRPIARPI